MSNTYASGKFAIAECDRCGQRYKLKELKNEIIKTRLFNIKVCPDCWDPDQPQLSLGMYPVSDPQALKEPRPDTSYVSSGTNGLQITGSNSTDSNSMVIKRMEAEYSSGDGIQ
jgi:NAD-dependent SIR2 family protein deacetylase